MTHLRITTRNAAFQQWQALLDNRTKRHRSRTFLVQGVRPINLALEAGWPVAAVLRAAEHSPSAWARRVWEAVGGDHVEMASGLLAELGSREEEDPPELVLVARMPQDELTRIPVGTPAGGVPPLVVALDRPTSPGNVGTLVRAADAFGATGVVVCGHAADPWDPRAVRASTGSVFAVPVVRHGSPAGVLAWARGHRLQVVGTDEGGSVDVRDVAWGRPTLLVVGNETRGMSATWREACDVLASIPMAGGAASSLNAATAGSIALHEAMRGRRAESTVP